MQGLQQLKINPYSSKQHQQISDEIILLLPVRAQQFFLYHPWNILACLLLNSTALKAGIFSELSKIFALNGYSGVTHYMDKPTVTVCLIRPPP